MVNTIIIHHRPIIIPSFWPSQLNFLQIGPSNHYSFPHKYREDVHLLQQSPHSLKKGPKIPKLRMGHKPWTNTMHYIKPWTNTMGNKILDQPIETLWRSPHIDFFLLLVTLFVCHTFATYFHITLYVDFTPYNPWFHSHWQP